VVSGVFQFVLHNRLKIPWALARAGSSPAPSNSCYQDLRSYSHSLAASFDLHITQKLRKRLENTSKNLRQFRFIKRAENQLLFINIFFELRKKCVIQSKSTKNNQINQEHKLENTRDYTSLVVVNSNYFYYVLTVKERS